MANKCGPCRNVGKLYLYHAYIFSGDAPQTLMRMWVYLCVRRRRGSVCNLGRFKTPLRDQPLVSNDFAIQIQCQHSVDTGSSKYDFIIFVYKWYPQLMMLFVNFLACLVQLSPQQSFLVSKWVVQSIAYMKCIAVSECVPLYISGSNNKLKSFKERGNK